MWGSVVYHSRKGVEVEAWVGTGMVAYVPARSDALLLGNHGGMR